MKKVISKLATVATAATLIPWTAIARERGGDSSFDAINSSNSTNTYINMAGGSAVDLAALIAKSRYSEQLKTEIELLQDKAANVNEEIKKIEVEKAVIADSEEAKTRSTRLTVGESTSQVERVTKTSQLVHHEVDVKMSQKRAELKAIETQISNLRATMLARTLEAGFKILRKGSTLLIVADAGSRIYIWSAMDKNPTFSPLLTLAGDQIMNAVDSLKK